MLRYKINVLSALKAAGYTTTVLRRKKILSESMITRLRNGETSLSMDSIALICSMLRCQPGDVLESEITDEERITLFLDTPARLVTDPEKITHG